MQEEIVMNDDIISTDDIIKEVIRLTMLKYTGRKPNTQAITKFSKYLDMEYENNTSKNSLDNRISSIIKTIEKKYEKYARVTPL